MVFLGILFIWILTLIASDINNGYKNKPWWKRAIVWILTWGGVLLIALITGAVTSKPNKK